MHAESWPIIIAMRLMTTISLAALFTGCASQQTAPSGVQTFMTHCASCHGPIGQGDGPVAASLRGALPDLRGLSQRNTGDFPHDRVAAFIDGRELPAAHGSREMPVWGTVFDATARLLEDAQTAEPRIAAILTYLEELQYR